MLLIDYRDEDVDEFQKKEKLLIKSQSAVTLPGDFDLEDRQYLPCRVLQVIKTCIISTLVPGKLGEVIRGSALDILYTMLSKFSKL
ncbi:hypothetical protein CISIN_1g045832mg [Citrus sinensis]|uniref:Uncharacterized protein n=1 Tax=Citrus sinensis TaxID=2711 RepID=A0A067E819_CITSI|nr:hypothetical protein CISIN_1g045832mg [Citrus sinensis]